ncbi:carbohydrate kinase [Flavihumibacter sp. RY-1]|uniref:Carbohydrate kinase n=1 Tax=Flavihumibacter fluminis TaxID=2909236 RepID=A0ABS9BKU2_9BACT|nr:FGGY family carbohydrate kinase [Flavihumibacter fluminis]MCF1715758.1 carbohydrate kinase [Flavihumibacter fluminis]
MIPIAVTAIFDIGKTNKKLLLFDEQQRVVDQYAERIEELTDEDGFPCDDILAIRRFIFSALDRIIENPGWNLQAVNFSAYGASLVYLDENGQPITPFYNYLKPYPDELSKALFEKYGGQESWSRETASPYLGSLNSGLQLYRLKVEQPELFKRLNFALHLPQYCSYLLTGLHSSDSTSIGCHTGLWDYEKNDYHEWVQQEGLTEKLAPLFPSDYKERVRYKGQAFWCGIGMHDSSAALVPYLQQADKKFALLSTGTWCITLNPFNEDPLTSQELELDCLCFLSCEGKPVKASRLFGGHEHEIQVKRIADHFQLSVEQVLSVTVDENFTPIPSSFTPAPGSLIEKLAFRDRSLQEFASASEAYHQLMFDLITLQAVSIRLVVTEDIGILFLEGGFARNELFIHFLKLAFPKLTIQFGENAQGAALGALLVLKDSVASSL